MRFSIGFAAPLSTPQSIVGLPMLRTVELAAADARASGVDVDIKAVDDRENERVAAEVAQGLAGDESIIAVVGHKNSGPSKAAAPIYAAAGLTQVTQCSTDNSLSRSGWRTFFRMCADNERQARVAAEFAVRSAPKHVCAVHDSTDYGRPLAEAFARHIEELSDIHVSVLSVTVGEEDFSEVIDTIVSSGADLVAFAATEIESSKLMRALRAEGVTARFISSEGGPDNPIVRLAGPAGEGSVHTYAGADPSATPAARELVRRARAEIGETPSYVVECYDAVGVIVEALRRGATTRTAVRDAVAVTDMRGVGGQIRFDVHGDRINAPVSLWTIANGRMVPVRETAVRG